MNDSQTKSAGKKPKLVRDSFTIPKAEYAAIDALKSRALKLGVGVKKSELLRAGLMLLQELSDARFKAAMASVPTIKTGRPLSLKVSARIAPVVASKPVAQPATRSAPAPVKAVVKKAAVKKAVAKKVPAKAAPKTAAVKASPTPKPMVQAPAPKPAALPPVAPAAKAAVQPAKKVVAKKAAVTQA